MIVIGFGAVGTGVLLAWAGIRNVSIKCVFANALAGEAQTACSRGKTDAATGLGLTNPISAITAAPAAVAGGALTIVKTETSILGDIWKEFT